MTALDRHGWMTQPPPRGDVAGPARPRGSRWASSRGGCGRRLASSSTATTVVWMCLCPTRWEQEPRCSLIGAPEWSGLRVYGPLCRTSSRTFP
eukprot:scaffold2088_cov399-Prasinococcus_capsulatus_cf.AAC.8